MKRSEMVLLIAERFRENGVRPTRIAIEEAEYLLDNIEEAGMLPPPTDIDIVTTHLLYCYYYENGRDSQDNLWEPEDE